MADSQESSEQRLAAFNQHRGLLFSIAYRMLGSWADAEDVVQETFIRWQQAPDTEIRSPRAFLVTIISRLSINHLQSARAQREEYVGQWLPEPLMTGPLNGGPSAVAQIDQSLSIAFLVLLERLSPMERAVFLLREVFDYEYSEIAKTLGQNEANCRQILRRARRHIAEERPRFDASPKQRESLLHEFLEATARGDLEGLVALLSKDAVFHSDGGGKAPALPKPVYGASNVARVILASLQKFVPPNIVRRIV
ncbi:MAG TPA: RNA polymerase sigma factor SigJ, partial [Bryobacteraceae bacterium]|nr:RNA polymerase sigma factor SigJ [Bryobacteraceae bacterium]